MRKKRSNKKKTDEEFMIESYCIHGDKYNYKFVEYKNAHTKVKIICNTCGCIFEQRAYAHLQNHGCPRCAIKKRKEKLSFTHNQFKNKIKSIHGNKFEYLTKYINNNTYITMKCNDCGYIFKQKPRDHLQGYGCSHCVGKFKEKYAADNIPVYIVYQPRLQPYGVECRRAPKDKNILEVRCMYCGKWYQPTLMSVKHKIRTIQGKGKGELNLYCSKNCKLACPTFYQKKYPKGFKQATSREVQPALRKLVLERDNWTCQKCEATDKQLHCHHITGIELNPIESADIDNCITFCIDCHNEVHKQKGCTYNDFKRKNCKN